MNKIKIIVTLGPSTSREIDLRKIKDKGVDFVRINMSHSSLDELRHYIRMAKRVGIPFVIDTEGSQVRTGNLAAATVEFEENDEVRICVEPVIGDTRSICLKPGSVVQQLEVGDIIHVDFDTLAFCVCDVSSLRKGYVVAKTITQGSLGRNKAVIIDSAMERKIHLPSLTEKDLHSIEIGLAEGVNYIAASFMRSGDSVDEVRRATQNTMKIISKIECVDALENLDAIIKKSDYLLIDRGDLSKEIPVEKVPFVQRIVIDRAAKQDVGVFVATNLLETMIEKRKPTRAEVHDVIDTIVDGAGGLTLAAETAIGKYPMACINMLQKLIKHSEIVLSNTRSTDQQDQLMECLERRNYLLDPGASSSLILPHGGVLVNRIMRDRPSDGDLKALPRIRIDEAKQMDVEQIAIGTYSPIDGFLGKEDLCGILDNMRLATGVVWPLPILLDVSEDEAATVAIGDDIALVDDDNDVMAILHLQEKYQVDTRKMAGTIYMTDSVEHPGVCAMLDLKPVFLAGPIQLLKRRAADYKEYELTPRQVRKIFEEKGWAKVVGFHTRNVIHRGHEYIQRQALEQENCDGLFVHPVVGRKKPGDFHAEYVLRAYDLMKRHFYPKDSVVFAAFSTYSRYAGPRESLFTALCRKNFGCSHFIVGRDHTGIQNFYHPKASHNIFDRFPDLGITPIRFDNVYYSKKLGEYIDEKESGDLEEGDRLSISGTQARKMFESGAMPPEWFMRPEISNLILDAVKKGQKIFV